MGINTSANGSFITFSSKISPSHLEYFTERPSAFVQFRVGRSKALRCVKSIKARQRATKVWVCEHPREGTKNEGIQVARYRKRNIPRVLYLTTERPRIGSGKKKEEYGMRSGELFMSAVPSCSMMRWPQRRKGVLKGKDDCGIERRRWRKGRIDSANMTECGGQ